MLVSVFNSVCQQ